MNDLLQFGFFLLVLAAGVNLVVRVGIAALEWMESSRRDAND